MQVTFSLLEGVSIEDSIKVEVDLDSVPDVVMWQAQKNFDEKGIDMKEDATAIPTAVESDGLPPIDETVEIIPTVIDSKKPYLRSKLISIEFVVKFHCPLIKNDGVFYTDSNGLDMMKRTYLKNNTLYADPKISKTAKYNNGFLSTAPPYNGISENYYPVTSAIVIRGGD